MSNTLLTVDQITKVAAVDFMDAMPFIKSLTRRYDDSFANKGAQIGDTLRVRLPQDYSVIDDNLDITSANKDTVQRKRSFQLAYTETVPMSFTTAEMTLSIENFREQFIKPAAHKMGRKVEARALAIAAKATPNAVGTRGTTPTAIKTFLSGRQKVYEHRSPDDMLNSVVNPATMTEIADSTKGLFVDAVNKQYAQGQVYRAMGSDFLLTNTFYTHTNGSNTSGTTNAANQGITTGWTEYTDLTITGTVAFKAGDIVTIQDVNATVPGTADSLGYLRQFVVLADAPSTTLRVSPAIISGGPYQNVDARAGTGKTITLLGSNSVASPESLVYHKDAFVFGMADLTTDGAIESSRFSDPDSGISIALVKGMDIQTRAVIWRLDCIWGLLPYMPEWACRVVG